MTVSSEIQIHYTICDEVFLPPTFPKAYSIYSSTLLFQDCFFGMPSPASWYRGSDGRSGWLPWALQVHERYWQLGFLAKYLTCHVCLEVLPCFAPIDFMIHMEWNVRSLWCQTVKPEVRRPLCGNYIYGSCRTCVDLQSLIHTAGVGFSQDVVLTMWEM